MATFALSMHSNTLCSSWTFQTSLPSMRSARNPTSYYRVQLSMGLTHVNKDLVRPPFFSMTLQQCISFRCHWSFRDLPIKSGLFADGDVCMGSRLVQQAGQRRWWWRLWFFFSVRFQKHVSIPLGKDENSLKFCMSVPLFHQGSLRLFSCRHTFIV